MQFFLLFKITSFGKTTPNILPFELPFYFLKPFLNIPYRISVKLNFCLLFENLISLSFVFSD
ncbi:hypothetical protein EGI31_07450 [Lacihabitans soyangensis]|uniref:Uncharacterized protein n=1 Tax=Lacihabitans soyangensis TaxID=869394 RepID=A0AAE3KS69_9BACT|nr:hypothetical protein [Lacihabitans soyangensis]